MPIYKTLKEQAEAIHRNADAIRFIENPHPRLCLMAVMNDPLSIKHIHNQTPALCELATAHNYKAFEYCEHQTFTMIKEAIDRNIENARKIKNIQRLSNKKIEALININPFIVTYLSNVDEKHLLNAVAQSANVIEKLDNLSHEFLINAVRVNPAILDLEIGQEVIEALAEADNETLLTVVHENPYILNYLPLPLQTNEVRTIAYEASLHQYNYMFNHAYA